LLFADEEFIDQEATPMSLVEGVSKVLQTRDDAVVAAQAVAARLSARVVEAERLGRLPDESVADLLNSGLLGLEIPTQYGGAELNIDVVLEVTSLLSEACSSTGWVYALWAAHTWAIGNYPEGIQEEVFKAARPIVSSAVNTEGVPVRVSGGYRWSGRAFFCSGVDHCSWLTVAFNLNRKDPAGDLAWFLIPRSELEIVDDWSSIGLRGTGSKTTVVGDAYIPDERIISFRDLAAGRGRGAQLYSSPLYQTSFDFTYTLPLVGPLLGIAQAARRTCEERLGHRFVCSSPMESAQSGILIRMATAAADIDAARSLVFHTARYCSALAANSVTTLDRTECWRNVAYAAQLCRRATNALFEIGGAAELLDQSQLQRLWRDCNAAAAHASLSWDNAALSYGRAMVGLPPLLTAGEIRGVKNRTARSER
jgi:alkylation response protein AidB-like acyl-CoA dehydrogenase